MKFFSGRFVGQSNYKVYPAFSLMDNGQGAALFSDDEISLPMAKY